MRGRQARELKDRWPKGIISASMDNQRWKSWPSTTRSSSPSSSIVLYGFHTCKKNPNLHDDSIVYHKSPGRKQCWPWMKDWLWCWQSVTQCMKKIAHTGPSTIHRTTQVQGPGTDHMGDAGKRRSRWWTHHVLAMLWNKHWQVMAINEHSSKADL